LTGGSDKLLKFWSISESRNIAKLSGPEKAIIDVDVSFDGNLALSAGHDSAIFVWNLKGQKISVCFYNDLGRILNFLAMFKWSFIQNLQRQILCKWKQNNCKFGIVNLRSHIF
jgi:WD40 repeat protein